MTTTTTRPIPLFGASEATPPGQHLREFLACTRCHYAPTCYNDTHPIVLADAQVRQRQYQCSPTRRLWHMQAVAVAALMAFRRAMADDELSRPLELPDLKLFAMWHDVGHLTAPHQQVLDPMVIVDAAEPCAKSVEEEPILEEPTLEYNWSKARRKIRAAARAFSEQTHADY
jgi:hypothetical protein